MRFWLWIVLFSGAAVTMGVLWLTEIPLGIPGEWTWQRTVLELDAVWNAVGIAVAIGLYAAFVEAGSRRLGKTDPKIRSKEGILWLVGLCVVAFAWLWIVQETSPTRNRLGKSGFVLFYSSSSGYFTKARYEVPDPAVFLAGYEGLMRERDVLHVGTHPPGLVLLFHELIALCDGAPILAGVLDVTQPESFRATCDVIARNSVRQIPPRLLKAEDRRVLWLATLLVMASAAAAVLPLFALIARDYDPLTAWWAAALWPAVPAVAIFIPKSDVAYAFVGLLMVLAWVTAVDRRSVVWGVVAGLLTWCGMIMSLAFLPVILFMVIVGKSKALPSAPDAATSPQATASVSWLPPVRCIGAAIFGFVAPTVLMSHYGKLNLPIVWLLNYQNHAAFYSEYTRTYWKWLLVNPVELAVAAGWPVLCLALVALIDTIRSRRLLGTRVALGTVIVLGTLWVTGKNSGEAARLWIVFLPWLIWLGAGHLARTEESPRLRPAILLVTQLIICALTVIRVSGFEI